MQWEYRTLTLGGEKDSDLGIYVLGDSHASSLNALGAEGWELVAVVPVTSDELLSAACYVLKRPSIESNTGARLR